jgi:hypothetical protein
METMNWFVNEQLFYADVDNPEVFNQTVSNIKSQESTEHRLLSSPEALTKYRQDQFQTSYLVSMKLRNVKIWKPSKNQMRRIQKQFMDTTI